MGTPVKDDDGIGGCEVDSKASCPRGQEEDEVRAVWRIELRRRWNAGTEGGGGGVIVHHFGTLLRSISAASSRAPAPCSPPARAHSSSRRASGGCVPSSGSTPQGCPSGRYPVYARESEEQGDASIARQYALRYRAGQESGAGTRTWEKMRTRCPSDFNFGSMRSSSSNFPENRAA
jgi:hypothetical protein